VARVASWALPFEALYQAALAAITADTGWSATAVTAAFSAGLVVSALAGIPVGRWLDRFGPRRVMTAGSLLGVPSAVAVALAPGYGWFLAAWLVAGVAMAAVFYQAAFAALTRWYGDRRVRALTTVTLVAGLSSTVFVPLTHALLDVLSWRGTYLVLAAVLLVAGGLLIWGNTFVNDNVHTQLAAQKIFFPPEGNPALTTLPAPDRAAMSAYAGQQMTNGAQAEAYADHFIAVHLKEVAGGKTYSEVSALSRANPQNQQLVEQTQTLFRGDTLRGLLLNVWGWATVGAIAYWVGIAALLGGIAVFIALALGYVLHERNLQQPAGNVPSATQPAVRTRDDISVPV
jgi:MFS family permease